MIKKFNEFDIINELKHSTYQSAASKLRRIGGVHKNRANNLNQWSYISLGKPLGTFNMHFDVLSMENTRRSTWDEFIIPSKIITNDFKGNTKIVKKGPLPVYLWGGLVDNPYELCNEDNMESLGSLNVMVGAISEECHESCYTFFISTKLIWEDGSFKIVSGSSELDPVNTEIGDTIALFSDRKSALKFKNVFLKQDNLRKMIDGFEELREFFMDYSTGEEWNNYFNELQSISINKLYQ